MYRSDDSGTTWFRTADSATMGAYPALSLSMSGDTIYAAGSKGVFRSSDGGAAWNKLGNLIDVYVVAALGPYLFAGTNRNLHYSADGGATWTPSTGLPNNGYAMMSLAVDGANLLAGTFLHGVWKRPLSELILPPPAPVSPASGAVDQAARLDLAWGSVAAAAAYHVQLSTSAAFSDTVAEDTAVSALKKAVGPLVPGKQYYWRVRSRSVALGLSPWSETRSFRVVTAAATPALVSPPPGALDQPVNVNLVWAKADKAVSYRVQVNFSDTAGPPLLIRPEATIGGGSGAGTPRVGDLIAPSGNSSFINRR